MDLSFQEKSAWGMLIGIVVISALYFPAAFTVVDTVGEALPLIGLIAGGIIALVIIEIIYHTVIAAWSSKEADQRDERDKLIDLKAERNAGFVLGFGLFWLIGWIIAQSTIQAYPVPEPLAITVFIMLAITVSEIAKLASQIWYYRTGV